MMLKLRHIAIIVCVIISSMIPSCIEPFEPEIDRYEDIMVVDGVYTDADEPMYVRLSRTSSYYDQKEELISGAFVVIVNDSGAVELYNEVSTGYYRLAQGKMPGEAGRSYKLVVETLDGDRYESDFQELKKAVEIDSVYFEVAEGLTTGSRLSDNKVTFYLDSKDEEGLTQYYSWDWTETWKYEAPHHKPGFEDRKICWRNFHSNEIVVNNTSRLTEDYNFKKELYTIDGMSSRLHVQYSTIIRQYSISRTTYEFLSKLQELNEQSGSIFDSPPNPVVGNMQNVNDPFEPVLGYFQVSGVSETRIFLSAEDLPKEFASSNGYDHCNFLQVQGEGFGELAAGWLLLERFEWMDTIWTNMTSHNDCYDCTAAGSNDEPDFWIEIDE
jgi:hypothetical protein